MDHPLHILLADDEKIVHQTIGDYLGKLGHSVDSVYDGAAALGAIEKNRYALALVDVRMPRLDGISLLTRVREIRPEMPVVIITGHGSEETAVEALRNGAADYLTKPVKTVELDAVLEKCARLRALMEKERHLRHAIGGIQASEALRRGDRRFVGIGAEAERVREAIRKAVEGRIETILITGETGTGKEVVAREVHFQAEGDESPFIAVNCPGLPESLVESELFGHVKGAFTGAASGRAGFFEQADGGTLFLDEVGDLSPPAQASLLRALDTRTFRRIGGVEDITVNLRVIAATNVPPEDLVQSGKLRRDLYYRLNVYAIRLLPLREHREDVLPLAEHFLTAFAQPRDLAVDGFSPEARILLGSYDFPGNARELRNIVERAAVLCPSGPILPEHLHLSDLSADAPAPQVSRPERDDERAAILRALEAARWNRRKAAQALGMPYSTLRYKIELLGIK